MYEEEDGVYEEEDGLFPSIILSYILFVLLVWLCTSTCGDGDNTVKSVFIEDDGEYWDSGSIWEGVEEEEGVYEEDDRDEVLYDDGDGVYDDGDVVYDDGDVVYDDGDGVYDDGEGSVDGVYEEGVEDNVIEDGGVSGKKRVGYVSANNPSLHDNKIYCVVFHKTVHIIFFSFSSFIF